MKIKIIIDLIIIATGFVAMLNVLRIKNMTTEENTKLKKDIEFNRQVANKILEAHKDQIKELKCLQQRIECEKCFCKKKPYIEIKEVPIAYTLGLRCDELDIKCEYKNINGMTRMCFAKDKKYIENKIKERQADERKRVFGNKTKEAE